MPSPHLTILVIPARAEGQRIDIALATLLPDRSRRSIRASIARGEVVVSGKIVRIASRPVAPGDTIELPSDASDPPPHDPLAVLAETGDYLALEKPPGVLSEPAASTGIVDAGATALEIARRMRALRGEPRPFASCVGRLDRPVSGLLLIAKSGEAHGGLVKSLQKPASRKIYLALTEGVPPAETGIIELPIRRSGPIHYSVVLEREGPFDDARQARTSYRVISKSGRFALVSIRLHTGRTHQARLHLAAIGAPIAGDSRYGPGAVNSPDGWGEPPQRVFLHAHRIEFRWSGAPDTILSPLPPDFREELARHRISSDLPADLFAED